MMTIKAAYLQGLKRKDLTRCVPTVPAVFDRNSRAINTCLKWQTGQRKLLRQN